VPLAATGLPASACVALLMRATGAMLAGASLTQFFFKLSLNTGFWVFTNFDSAARKLPFTSVVHCEDSLAVIDEQNTFD
jgi:hypothetical protein